MAGQKVGGNKIREDQLLIPLRSAVTQKIGGGQMSFGLEIILLEEVDHPQVVFKSDDVRLGKGREGRDVGGGGVQGTEDVFRKGDGVVLEVSFEEQVGDIVDAPLARVLYGTPVEEVSTYGTITSGESSSTGR